MFITFTKTSSLTRWNVFLQYPIDRQVWIIVQIVHHIATWRKRQLLTVCRLVNFHNNFITCSKTHTKTNCVDDRFCNTSYDCHQHHVVKQIDPRETLYIHQDVELKDRRLMTESCPMITTVHSSSRLLHITQRWIHY